MSTRNLSCSRKKCRSGLLLTGCCFSLIPHHGSLRVDYRAAAKDSGDEKDAENVIASVTQHEEEQGRAPAPEAKTDAK